MTVTFTANAAAAGGNVTLAQKMGSDFNYIPHTVTSGTNTIDVDFVYNDDYDAEYTDLLLGGLGNNSEITGISFGTPSERPTAPVGVGMNYTMGLEHAGGKTVTVTWTDPTSVASTSYIVNLKNSSGTVINTITGVTAKTFTFVDGAKDSNNQTITISPHATYDAEVATVLGGNTSAYTASSNTVDTGDWIRMGSITEWPNEDTLAIDANTRVSSVYGNLYYYYSGYNSLSTIRLKKTSNAESDPANYYYHKVGRKNSAVFNNIENGTRCRLTVTFTANAAASGKVTLQQTLASESTYTDYDVEAGTENTFSVDCDYNSTYANEYTELLLGGLGANSEITGISFSVTVLEHWTAGTADGGWHDVGDYGYHIPSGLTGMYSTDTGYNFSLKSTQVNHQWNAFYVGTKEMQIYSGSVYSYDIRFHRTKPVTDPTDNQNRVYLHILYDTGQDYELGYGICDETGSIRFTGDTATNINTQEGVNIPNNATTARLYWICQWPGTNERFSVDPVSGSKYTFEELWRPVDETQEVREGKFKFVDKDGGALQYKPSQTSGTGSCDVRVHNGSEDPWVPYIKTNFAEGDYGVNFVEGNEYIATITFDSNKVVTTENNKGIRISDYNSGQGNSIALTGNSFEITFIYKDGYDITAGLGYLGDGIILSNFNVSIRDGAPTMPLTNDGTNVIANWGGMSGVSGATKLVYVSFGEQKIIDVSGQSSYTFPSPFYPDNDTEVELYDSYTSSEVHGTKLTRATALADFQIMDARVDGIAHANTNNIIKMVLKNVGTGKVIASDANQKFIYLTARQDDWRNYKYLCPDPQDLATDVVLDPNEEFDENSPFFERPCIDAWRVYEEGTYTIRCQVNETKIIREKNYANNSFTFRKEVSTQLADDTAVLGFQLNTNKSPGGPSEFSPSYRTVCRANKQVVVKEGDYAFDEDGNRLDVPTGTYTADDNNFEYGFVYAYRDKAGLTSKNEDELMTFAGAKGNDYIKTLKANSKVDIDKWTTKDGSTYNKDNSFFFALTLKDLYYTTDQIEQVYTFRSYLKFTTGGKEYIVYPKDVYSTSMYDIAEDLYRNKKMPSEAAHNYLYDNILNIVSMKHNAQNIGKAMMKKLRTSGEMTSSSSPHYRSLNNVYQDMTFYALCSDAEGKTGTQYDAMIYLYADNIKRVKKNDEGKTYEISGEPKSDEVVKQSAYTYNGYTYTHDREFRSIRLDKSGEYNSFLAALNASKTESETNYESVYDWIYGEVPHDTGFYKKVDYSWDSNLDKDYGTE